MAYLDDEKLFYDYGTKDFDGVNPFDERKTGVSFYNQFFSDPDYMEQYKNLEGKIVQMSPEEYFLECAKIFSSSKEKQIAQTGRDEGTLKHLNEVLLKWKKTFPITFLNYAENSQEGRHRMYVVGELLGWTKKFPVLIVDWADPLKEKEKQIAQQKDKEDRIISAIDETTKKLASYEYEDVEEIIEDLKWDLDIKFSNVQIEFNDNVINFDIDGVKYKVPIWNFNILFPDDIIDESYEEIISELKRVGLYS